VRAAVFGLATVFSGITAMAQPPATLRGRVLDAQTGEPLAKARVSVRGVEIETRTDEAGRFELAGLPAGEVEIAVATVGYGVVRRTVATGAPDLEIRLNQDALKRSEEVVVTAPPFTPLHPAAPSEMTIEGTELKNLSSVLADDPLRSVQSLPGVAATDDFNATFAVRGYGFTQVGLYVDGVLLGVPFHTVRNVNVNDSYSLTVVNGDVVESLSLTSGGAPAAFGERVGPVLDVATRDGSAERFYARANVGVAGVSGVLEGPLGANTTGLVCARKSFLDYVLKKVRTDGILLGYADITGKLTHRLTGAHTLSLTLLHGRSTYQTDMADLFPSAFFQAHAGTDLAALRWRFLPSERASLSATAFGARDTGRNENFDDTERYNNTAPQAGLRVDGMRAIGRHRVEAGVLGRRMSERAIHRAAFSDDGATVYRVDERYASGGTTQAGAYLQDTWTGLGERLSLTLGGRVDHFAWTDETRVSPRASATLTLSPRTNVFGAWGAYAQFPSFDALLGDNGTPGLRAERSQHRGLGVERLLGATTRVRLEVYDHSAEDVLFDRAAEWRVVEGHIVPPGVEPGAPASGIQNALSGRSRGVEILLQRRSANGLSGWIAYAFGRAWVEDARGVRFDTDFDQRHTVSLFGSYRVSATVNLSAKFRYGSGLPLAGYFEERPDGTLGLSARRNRYRPDAYSRADLRANKAFLFDRWKLTLYGEVLNVFDRPNRRFADFDLDRGTGRVELFADDLFPLLPSAGVTVEF
jgi:hypothetical protein